MACIYIKITPERKQLKIQATPQDMLQRLEADFCERLPYFNISRVCDVNVKFGDFNIDFSIDFSI